MNYAESVSYMQGLLRFGEKYGNERFEALLELLGSPHRQFRALHIAGTKGKGSTTTFAASVLTAAGYKTGSYLSPYVYDLRERVQIDGQMISQDNFARIMTNIRPHVELLTETEFGQTTEFEIKTAVAFCWFAEQNVDYAVVEVGLGGRLDATNVLPNPLVSVITNIGYDHMEILGGTLELIATEKAGIIKQNGLCCTGVETGPALDTIESICRERDAKLIRTIPHIDWKSESDGTLWVRTPTRTLAGLRLGLRGPFQHANASLAIRSIDSAGIPHIDDESARRGLESAFAPGRLEVVRTGSPTVVLDAAHNELAASVLTQALELEFSAAERDIILVVGLSRRHDPADLLAALRHLDPALLIASEPSFHPRPAEDTVAAAAELGFRSVRTLESVPKALADAYSAAKTLDNALIVVTGSFFTVGDLPPEVRESIFDQV